MRNNKLTRQPREVRRSARRDHTSTQDIQSLQAQVATLTKVLDGMQTGEAGLAMYFRNYQTGSSPAFQNISPSGDWNAATALTPGLWLCHFHGLTEDASGENVYITVNGEKIYVARLDVAGNEDFALAGSFLTVVSDRGTYANTIRIAEYVAPGGGEVGVALYGLGGVRISGQPTQQE